MRRIAFALLFLLTACAEEQPAPQPDRWSGDPDADLEATWKQDDPLEVLASWPVEREGYRKAEATQIALTERVAGSIEHEAVFEAYDDVELLRTRFGAGRRRDGRILSISAMRAGLLDAVIDTAHTLVAGDRPDRDKALEAIRIAVQIRSDDDGPRLERTLRWIEADTLDELTPETPLSLSPHDGPCVVALMDHFTLGEANIRAVLQRWAKHPRLRVSFVPLWRGTVRMGIRRVPATRREERAIVRASAKEFGLHYEKGAAKTDWSDVLGLGRTSSALLVLNREGTIVGRLRGTFFNPQRVEGSVQRVTTR